MKKILIANRGEIAVRIIKTCREMGITTVAVASEADRNARHSVEADECHIIGPPPAGESYLLGNRIVDLAVANEVDGIHPGFGFLSENADFAGAVRQAGITFVGPSVEAIEVMGSKQRSKQLMQKAGVPTVPGYHGQNQDPGFLQEKATEIGFPLLIKASAGGGGKGMRVVHEPDAFVTELDTAKREARAAFGDDTVLLERYLRKPRHIEFQIMGDQHGHLIHLFERECSIQRRHQKIVEETPSTALDETLRGAMAEAALAAGKAVGYDNAGTVEFMLDEDGSFYFLEMNTRLQVEHPITEMITGLDLVKLQIKSARGEILPLAQNQVTRRGHAIEVRVYAEDPANHFFPQTGTLVRYREPEGLGIRVDSGIREGDEISVFYDPMVAKLIAYGHDREEARTKLRSALSHYPVHGVRTNIGFLREILGQEAFIAGDTTTDYLERNPVANGADPPLEVVLALASLAEPANRTQGTLAGKAEVAENKDPWQTLPQWRIARGGSK